MRGRGSEKGWERERRGRETGEREIEREGQSERKRE